MHSSSPTVTAPGDQNSVIEEIRDSETVTAKPSRAYAILRILATAGAVLLSQSKREAQQH